MNPTPLAADDTEQPTSTALTRPRPKRARRVTAERDAAITVTLGYRAPYDVDALLAFLAQRTIPGVEAADGPDGAAQHARRRRRRREAGWLEARFAPSIRRASSSRSRRRSARRAAAVIAAVRRWLDLDAAPETIAEALADLPGAPGLRLPGSVDAFELAVRAVLGQQVTVAARAHARATPRRALRQPRRRRRGPTSTARFPRPAASRRRAGRAHRRARHHPQPRRRDPGARRDGATSRRCSRPALRPMRSSSGCARCPASAPGRRTTSRCARSAGPMPFRPATSPPEGDAALFSTTTPRTAEAHARAGWRPWRAYALLRLWNSLGVTP